MTTDLDRLDEEISRRYPCPLAASFYRAYHSTRDPDEQYDHLLDLFKVRPGRKSATSRH